MVNYGESDYMKALGITIDPNLMEVDGRVLPPPVVNCSHTGQYRSVVSSLP